VRVCGTSDWLIAATNCREHLLFHGMGNKKFYRRVVEAAALWSYRVTHVNVNHCITKEMGPVYSVLHMLFMNLIKLSTFILSQKC